MINESGVLIALKSEVEGIKEEICGIIDMNFNESIDSETLWDHCKIEDIATYLGEDIDGNHKAAYSLLENMCHDGSMMLTYYLRHIKYLRDEKMDRKWKEKIIKKNNLWTKDAGDASDDDLIIVMLDGELRVKQEHFMTRGIKLN